MLTDLWHDITARQPDPPYLLILITAFVALIAVAVRRVWRLVRNAITIAHEGGHALVAVLCGRRLQSIRLQSDTSGLTVTKGKTHGLGMILTLAVGYIMPSLLGLGGAWLLDGGHIRVTLWLCIILLIPVLLMVRNFYGLLAVLITGGIIFAVSWFTPASVQSVFAYASVWFLLIGGVRPIFELASQRRRGKANDSDVDQLAGLTHIPGGAWLFLYGLISLAALAVGGILLNVAHGHANI